MTVDQLAASSLGVLWKESLAYPSIAYPVVQKRGIDLKAQIQLLFLLAVNLLNSPLLELV